MYVVSCFSNAAYCDAYVHFCTQLDILGDSMQSIDRLILDAEEKKADLFYAFNQSAFQGYTNLSRPKETLRALLRFTPTVAQ